MSISAVTIMPHHPPAMKAKGIHQAEIIINP
jgi:hypothetical protein